MRSDFGIHVPRYRCDEDQGSRCVTSNQVVVGIHVPRGRAVSVCPTSNCHVDFAPIPTLLTFFNPRTTVTGWMVHGQVDDFGFSQDLHTSSS